jgi:hypothetical protein
VAARNDFGFTARELRTLRSFRNPRGVQRALDRMPYHVAHSAWPPRRVLHEWTAHCLEGAVFAAVALRVLGFPPLLLDLEAVQDTDRVIAVFKERGHWGAIAKSNFSGLRYREPVYRTLRELVMSYTAVDTPGWATYHEHSTLATEGTSCPGPAVTCSLSGAWPSPAPF